jgi:hypothetical protein
LQETTLIRLAPYRLAPPRMLYVREHIKKLLRDGVICIQLLQPHVFGSPTGGTYRAAVDCSSLNKRNAIQSDSLPDILSTFHWFAKAKYFTSTYIRLSSKPLTAFCADCNFCQYTVCNLGLRRVLRCSVA